MSAVLAYALGLLTLPLLAAVVWFGGWALMRSTGSGSCVACDHARPLELGEHLNITVFLNRKVHDVVWASRRWHRKRVAEHFARFRNPPVLDNV